MPSADVPAVPPHDADAPRSRPAGTGQVRESDTMLRRRRAPKLAPFLILGTAVGVIAGIVIGVVGSGNVQFTTGQVIGFMMALFGLLGLGLGAIAALIADRISIRRAQDVPARAESSRHADPAPEAAQPSATTTRLEG